MGVEKLTRVANAAFNSSRGALAEIPALRAACVAGSLLWVTSPVVLREQVVTKVAGEGFVPSRLAGSPVQLDEGRIQA